MSTARKVLSNTIFQVIGKAITAVLGIVVIKALTHYLGAEGYGQYVTVFEFLAFFGIVSDFGFFTIAVREMSRDETKIPYIIGNVLGLRTALAFLTMALASIAAFLIPRWSGTFIPLGVAIAAIGTFITIASGTISSVLQVNFKMKYDTLGQVLGKIVTVSVMLYVIFMAYQDDVGRGFYQIIWAGVLGSVVMISITYFFARRFTEIKYRFDFWFWKKLFIESLPFGVALVLNTFYQRADVLLLSWLKGSSDVGIYGVAMKMLNVVYFLPVYFMNSVLPVLTRAITEKSEKIKTVMQYSFDFLVMSSLPILAGGFVLAYPIIFVISTPEFLSRLSEGFYGSDIALQILLFAMVFSFLNTLFGLTLVAIKQQIKLMWINGGCVLFNIIANLLVIPVWGFRGAAITSVLSQFFILIATWRTAQKFIKFKISLKTAGKIILSAVMMAVCVYGLRDPLFYVMENKNVLVLIPLGAMIYGAMLILTRAVTKETFKIFRK